MAGAERHRERARDAKKAGRLRAEAVSTQRPALAKERRHRCEAGKVLRTLSRGGDTPSTLLSPEATGVTITCQQWPTGPHHSHTWKTSAGAPPYFLPRPAAFLSAAVQSSAFVFQLLLSSLLLETWDIKGKGEGIQMPRKWSHHYNQNCTCTDWTFRIPSCKMRYVPTLKHHLEVVRDDTAMNWWYRHGSKNYIYKKEFGAKSPSRSCLQFYLFPSYPTHHG